MGTTMGKAEKTLKAKATPGKDKPDLHAIKAAKPQPRRRPRQPLPTTPR